MAMWLKQSTAATVKLGPFVDSTDGVTAETTLTISQADIRLTKNGGDIAQSNNAAGATHDELGYYDVPLDTTDTNTLGRLRVIVSESGALPVWTDFMVVPANVWDSFFGSDKLQVDAVELSGDSAAADNAEAFFDGTGYAGTNNVIPTVTNLTNKGDGSGFTAVPWNAAWDAEVQSEVADALAVYDPPTNAEMEARTLAAADYATATDLATVDGKIDVIDDLIDTEIAAILEDTGTTLDGLIDTEVAAIKAKTDSLTFTVAGQVDANVQAVNDVTLTGTGTNGDEWGPA